MNDGHCAIKLLYRFENLLRVERALFDDRTSPPLSYLDTNSTHFSPTFLQRLFPVYRNTKISHLTRSRLFDVNKTWVTRYERTDEIFQTRKFIILRNMRKKAVPPVIWKGTACKFLTIFLRESYRVLHRSRDLCGDRIARPSSCGSRYVDYIVLAGGSSVRRCTKAWTMLAHTRAHIHVSTRFHPLDQAILSLSLSRLAYPLHSYFPIHRFANVIVSLSLVLRRASLPSSYYAYYLPAKCTFHSRDFLSTLPPLFSLHSSPFPISSRFPETSVRDRD